MRAEDKLVERVRADEVKYERRPTGDADLSRFYRHYWHVAGRPATPYETRLLENLWLSGILVLAEPLLIGPVSVAVQLREGSLAS